MLYNLVFAENQLQYFCQPAKSVDGYYGRIYVDKDPDTIYDTICYFEEYDNQDVLVIKVRDFDRTLYKIVKKKSTHTVL